MTSTNSTTMASMANDATTNSSTPAAKTAPLSPRTRIARLILIYHFVLIGASCVLYILRGFDFEEFTSQVDPVTGEISIFNKDKNVTPAGFARIAASILG